MEPDPDDLHKVPPLEPIPATPAPSPKPPLPRPLIEYGEKGLREASRERGEDD
jgi:hypothetical protein